MVLAEGDADHQRQPQMILGFCQTPERRSGMVKFARRSPDAGIASCGVEELMCVFGYDLSPQIETRPFVASMDL